MAPVAGQPGRGKRVGHRGVTVPDEQGTLQGEGHGLGEPAGPGLRRVAELLPQPGDGLIQPPVRPGGLIQFGEECLRRLGLPRQGAQGVERSDVA